MRYITSFGLGGIFEGFREVKFTFDVTMLSIKCKGEVLGAALGGI